jgi:hypothetical protein
MFRTFIRRGLPAFILSIVAVTAFSLAFPASAAQGEINKSSDSHDAPAQKMGAITFFPPTVQRIAVICTHAGQTAWAASQPIREPGKSLTSACPPGETPEVLYHAPEVAGAARPVDGDSP